MGSHAARPLIWIITPRPSISGLTSSSSVARGPRLRRQTSDRIRKIEQNLFYGRRIMPAWLDDFDCRNRDVGTAAPKCWDVRNIGQFALMYVFQLLQIKKGWSMTTPFFTP